MVVEKPSGWRKECPKCGTIFSVELKVCPRCDEPVPDDARYIVKLTVIKS